MIIVESIDELNELKVKLETEASIWYPLWVDNDKHPLNTTISFIFVRTQSDRYILPHQHTDALSLSNEQIEGVLNTAGEKWVFQKKKLLQSFVTLREGLNDVDTAYFLKTGETIDYSQPLQHLVAPLLHKGYREDIIQSIPILKLAEAVEPELLKHTNQKSKTYNWYNDIFLPTLSDIERYGIRVDREKFIDRWPQNQKHISTNEQGTFVYTEYNPYTITSRPSNRHGGVNFSALNKSDGTRESFIPPDGSLFLQFDYDAYHVRLIGKLIKYELPKTSVHQWLADQYGCSYDESKGRTFRILYGGTSEEDRKIPFFDKVDKFIMKFHEQSVRNGYITTPKGRKIPLGWVEQPNAQKFFNYLLQATETEFNIEVMEKLRKSKLPLPILYTYDSFLFEFDDSEVETIKEVKSVLESYGFPVKADWGKNYGEI